MFYIMQHFSSSGYQGLRERANDDDPWLVELEFTSRDRRLSLNDNIKDFAISLLRFIAYGEGLVACGKTLNFADCKLREPRIFLIGGEINEPVPELEGEKHANRW